MTDTYSKEDLLNSLVEGKTFDEAVPEMYNMMYFYVNKYYEPWRNLFESYCYSKSDIVQDVFTNLCNKKNSDVSNIQKKFIEASRKNLGMIYISRVIGKAVYLNLLSLAKLFGKRNISVSLETIPKMLGGNESSAIDHFSISKDKSQDMELKTSYDFLLMGIENKSYKNYYTLKNNKKIPLSVYDVLDMITDGYSVGEMSNMVYFGKSNINYRAMNEIVKEVRNEARRAYLDGSCLLDINIGDK